MSLTTRVRTRATVVAATTAAGILVAPGAAQADEPDPEVPDPEPDRLVVSAPPPPRLLALLPAADRLAAIAYFQAAAEDDGAEAVHVVEAGESLAGIAAEHGIESGGWRRLFDANPELEDPHLIEPGLELRIPHPEAELEPRELPTTTVTSAPGTATPAPEPSPAGQTEVTTTGPGVWDRLAECESNGNWSANTGNGYHGGLQFHPQTWTAHGGGEFAASAHQATRDQQIVVAERVLGSQGWGAWPACSRRLGLR